MKVFKDCEVLFSDVFMQKPVRTLSINTTAPVQVTNDTTPCSSGVATFTGTYSDRFIVWRAIGQKLFLEDRSICRSVQNGSLCIDFGRTSIIPGTQISIQTFKLILVVPTQSGVHRFVATIKPDPMDELNVEVQSLFSQINDKDFTGENHFSVMLTTAGEVKKAAVLTDLTRTKVAYSMTNGQLVLMTIPWKKNEPSEETVLREDGLLSRLWNAAAHNFLVDIDGTITSRGEFIFYGLYKDGSVKLWNVVADKITASTIQLKKVFTEEHFDKSKLQLRVHIVKGQTLLMLAVVDQRKTSFYCFLQQPDNAVTLVSSTSTNYNDKLIDFRLMYNNQPDMKLFAIWGNVDVPSDYTLAYTPINIDNDSERGSWVEIDTLTSRLNDYAKMTVEEIKESIFDSDKRSFETVQKGVELTCEGSNYEIAHQDWRKLTAHVEHYLKYPENARKYKERKKVDQAPRTENDHFEKKFYMELVSNCDQLEENMGEALSLLMVDVEGASFVGVILAECFTVVCHPKISVDSSFAKVLDELVVNLPRKADKGKSLQKILSKIGEDVGEKCCNIIQQVLNTIDMFQKVPTPPRCFPFRGRFTAGLVSAFIKQYLTNYIDFAEKMLNLRDMMKTADIDGFEGLNSILIDRLGRFLSSLQFIQKIFNHKINVRSSVYSLGSWIFLANDLATIRSEGSAEIRASVQKMNYNSFLDSTISAAFRALPPHSNSLVVCRLLAENSKWQCLYKVCLEYNALPGNSLKAVLQYYMALSLSGCNHSIKALDAFKESFTGIERGEEALSRALRPAGSTLTSPVILGEVYAHAIKFLNEQNQNEEIITLSKMAIEALPDGDQYKNSINATFFNLLMNRANWTEALDTIRKDKDPETRKGKLNEFIYRLLRTRDWKTVNALYYGELEPMVEIILLTSARSQEVEAKPHLFELIFSYYMSKYRFSKAAQTMLEYSHFLKEATQTKDLLKRRRDALATASTVFELIPEKDRFTFFPEEKLVEVEMEEAVVPDGMEMDQPANASRLVAKRTTLIVTDKSVQSDWILAKARCIILSDGITPPISEAEILKLLIEKQHYDEAFDVCREFDLDTSDLFFALTRDTIMLDCAKYQEPPTWFQHNRRHIGKALSHNWSIVQGLVTAARKIWPCDSRPYRAVLTAILSHDVSIPCWLQAEYSDFDIGDYARCLADFNQIALAADCLTDYVERELDKAHDSDVRTLLPLVAINDVIHVGSTMEDGPQIIEPLNKSLNVYFSRISAFEKAARFAS